MYVVTLYTFRSAYASQTENNSLFSLCLNIVDILADLLSVVDFRSSDKEGFWWHQWWLGNDWFRWLQNTSWLFEAVAFLLSLGLWQLYFVFFFCDRMAAYSSDTEIPHGTDHPYFPLPYGEGFTAYPWGDLYSS